MCLYHVSTQGPCVRGLCWVWSRHGPPSCGQAHSCSSFIILTSRRDSINHNTSFANVTSLHRTLPGREPQLSCGGWADVEDSSLRLTDPQQGLQAPGTGPEGFCLWWGRCGSAARFSPGNCRGVQTPGRLLPKAAKSLRHYLK